MRARFVSLVLLGGALVGGTRAASNPFSDVPRTHWAYRGVQAMVDAGLLEGYDGKFQGEKLLNRYQMAVITKRLLDVVGRHDGPPASAADLSALRASLAATGQQIASLRQRLERVEAAFPSLRARLEELRRRRATGWLTAPWGQAPGTD